MGYFENYSCGMCLNVHLVIVVLSRLFVYQFFIFHAVNEMTICGNMTSCVL